MVKCSTAERLEEKELWRVLDTVELQLWSVITYPGEPTKVHLLVREKCPAGYSGRYLYDQSVYKGDVINIPASDFVLCPDKASDIKITIIDVHPVPGQIDYGTVDVECCVDTAVAYAYVTCYVKPVDEAAQAGVQVYCDVTNETKTTNAAGVVSFQMSHGNAYKITVTPPAGYVCDCWNCVCEQSGIAKAGYDPSLPFRYAKPETPPPAGWQISGPTTAMAGEKFIINSSGSGAPVSKDSTDYIEIKTDKEYWFDPVIGRGTSDVEGNASIECTIPEAGDYTVYAYYPGSILPGGEKSDNTLPISISGEPVMDFTLSIPTLNMAGEVKVSGTAPRPNQELQIVAVKKFIGFDFLAADDVLATVLSGADNKYEATLNLDEFGIIEVYSRIPKDWWAVLDKDVTSPKHTVFVFTWEIIIFLVIAAILIYDKASGGKLGLLKRKR